jgi:hypothetical protein
MKRAWAMRMGVGWLAMVTALVTIASTSPAAWVASGPTWATSIVEYYINRANLDLPVSAIEPALRAGADVWYLQSGAGFRFAAAGLSTQTTTDYDGVNLVVFRDASNGSAIATTYWWSIGSNIVDADIVFWDKGFRFFTGSTDCSDGFYIEDVAAHEFGHALGLGHSTVNGATMYASTSYCNVGSRTLDADDIAGVRALYPPTTGAPKAPTGFRIAF